MKLVFRGAAQEVGRSCIELQTKQSRVLIDAGLEVTEAEPLYPVGKEKLIDVDAVFLSHAHLDHSGALPLLNHMGLKCPIFCTHMTKYTDKILLKDSQKLERLRSMHPAYEIENVFAVLSHVETIKYNVKGRFKDINYSFYDAGHIPGSALVNIKAENKTIFYTGDINTTDSRLLKGASLPDKKPNILITEATYGNTVHKDRSQLEKEFVSAINSTLDKGGTALIPVFAVGRAQEIAMIIAEQNFDVPVYIDGMAKEIVDLYLKYPEYIKNHQQLKKAFRNIQFVQPKSRNAIIREQSIIISTSGMMNGGPVLHYAKHLSHNKDNSILLTGYVAEKTNGRMLLDTGKIFIDGFEVRAECEYKQFHFSAHLGRKQLESMIKKTNPEKIILIHGEEREITPLDKWCKDNGFDACAPKLGESITV
ncbi:MAG: MBL fold metallo-hydrolase [Candidatus Woesearchaeota archaeon]